MEIIKNKNKKIIVNAQVSAFDESSSCGREQNHSTLHYWLPEGPNSNLFKLDPITGLLCIKEWLDFESIGPLLSIQLNVDAGNNGEMGEEVDGKIFEFYLTLSTFFYSFGIAHLLSFKLISLGNL